MVHRSIVPSVLICLAGVALLLGSCVSQQDNRVLQAGVVEAQALEIDRLNTRVAQLDAELQLLLTKQRLLERQAHDSALEAEQHRSTIEELRRLLSLADKPPGNREPDSASVELLKQQLAESERALRASQKEVARFEAQLEATQQQHKTRISGLTNELAATVSELEMLYASSASLESENVAAPGSASEWGARAYEERYFTQSDDELVVEPTIIKVFYGTNRGHLQTSASHYLSPFLLPVILLIVLFGVPRAVRAIIQTYLQRVTINLFRVALVLGVMYSGFSAVHQTAQRLQDTHTLPLQYGTERLTVSGDGRSYKLGVVDVSIPPNHVKGNVERANFVYFEFRSDPAKHFVLTDIDETDDNDFFKRLNKRVSESDDEDLFVFVHGFHNTFEDAAFRTAQIAHDSGFKGAPVFYSWPSQGSVVGYTTDENNVEEAKLHLTGFLEQINERSGAKRIHLIAHSMGSRALTAAVHAIALKNSGTVFDEMVLAAPDLDADTFKGMAPELTRVTSRLTLYASSKDSALSMSRRVHGGKYQRAGESFPTPVTVVPVDTIDVSTVTAGHSYIADSGHILDDLNNILVNGRILDSRIARRLCVFESEDLCQQPENLYWQLVRSD